MGLLQSDSAIIQLRVSDLKVIGADEAFYAIIGRSPENFERELQSSLMEIVDADDRSRFTESLVIHNAHDIIEADFCVMRPDDAKRHVLFNGEYVRIDDVTVIKADLIDISQRSERVTMPTDIPQQLLYRMLEKVQANIGIFEIAPKDIRALYMNASYFAMTGYDAEDYKSSDALKNVLPEDVDVLRKLIYDSAAIRQPIEHQFRIRRRGGGVIWLHMKASEIEYKQDANPIYLAFFTDITKVMDSEVTLHSIMRSSIGSVYRLKVAREFPVLFANDAYYLQRGITRAEAKVIYGDNEMPFIHPDDVANVEQRMMEALRKKRSSITFEHRLVSKDGTVRHMLSSCVMDYADGEIIVNVTGNDISQQKYLENNLKATSKQLQAVMDNSDVGIAINKVKDGVSRIIFCNKSYCEMAGYEYDDYIRNVVNNFNLIYYEDREKLFSKIETMMSEGTSFVEEYRIVRKDLSVVWVRLNASRIVFNEDEPPVMLSIISDISEMKQHEEQLEESSNRIQDLIDGLPIGVAVFEYKSNRMRLDNFNNAFCDLYGYTREEIEQYVESGGDIISVCLLGDNKEFAANIEETMRSGEVFNKESRAYRKDGTLMWAKLSCARLQRPNNVSPYCMLVITDITELKDAERSLRESLNKLHLSEERYRVASTQSNLFIWEYDYRQNRFLQEKRGGFGFGKGVVIENVPQSVIDSAIVEPEYAAEFIAAHEQIRDGAPKVVFTTRLRTDSGEYCWVRIAYTNVFDGSGEPYKAIGVCLNVNDVMEARAKLTHAVHYKDAVGADAYATIEANISEDKVQRSDGDLFDILALNPQCSYTQFLFAMEDLRIGTQYKSEVSRKFDRAALLKAYQEGMQLVSVDYLANVGSSQRWMSLNAYLYDAANHDVCCIIYERDIDEQKNKEIELIDKASRDSMTGAYNHSAFIELANKQLVNAPDAKAALLLIDVDDFKEVNDRYGHPYGDKVLIAVVETIRTMFFTRDIVGRVGGDEFAVFMYAYDTEESVYRKTEELCRRIYQKLDNMRGTVSVSVGVSLYPKHSTDLQELIEMADKAQYKAKAEGKNRYALYDDSIKSVNDEYVAVSNREWLVDSLDEVVYVTRPDSYELVYLNLYGRQLFEIDKPLSNCRCYELLYGREHPCPQCMKEKLSFDHYTVFEHTDSRSGVRYSNRSRLIFWDGSEARLTAASDVSDKEQLKQQLHTNVLSKRIIMSCMNSFVSIEDPCDALHEVLSSLGNFYHAHSCFVVGYDKRQEVGTTMGIWTRENAKYEIPPAKEWKLRPLWTSLFHTDGTYKLENIDALSKKYPEECKYYSDMGVQSVIALPFDLSRDVTCVLGINNITRNSTNLDVIREITESTAAVCRRILKQQRQE